MPDVRTVNLAQAFASFQDHWSPKVAADINDHQLKLVKVKGEFVWHHHEREDELFQVTRGTLRIRLRDGEAVVRPGEFVVIPRGVEHCPVADDEVEMLLLEPRTTVNTGGAQDGRTKRPEELGRV